MSKKKESKPQQIINFNHIFEKHSPDSFIAIARRKQIFKEIDEFLEADKVDSPILLILGESGIGKTALFANYIYGKDYDRRDDFIHFFIEYGTDTVKPQNFINHIYHSLCWIYEPNKENTYNIIKISGVMLKNKVWEISEKYLKVNDRQVIFVDAIDESIVENYPNTSDSIVRILNTLKFPNNFRVVLSSSSSIPELRLHDYGGKPNIIYLRGDTDKDNKVDIEQYFLENLKLNKKQSKELETLVHASEGNFQYAQFFVQMWGNKKLDLYSLMKKPPQGLLELYEIKLEQIRHVVSNKDFKNIWKIMRTISLLLEPQSPETICDILRINREEKKVVFRPIEKFLNISAYGKDSTKCWLYHRSFQEFVSSEKNLSESNKISTYRRVVRYIEDSIAQGRCRELPSSLIQYYFHYCSYASVDAKLDLIRYKYLSNVSDELFLPSRIPIGNMFYFGMILSLGLRSFNMACFYALMWLSWSDHVDKQNNIYNNQPPEIQKMLKKLEAKADEEMSQNSKAKKLMQEGFTILYEALKTRIIGPKDNLLAFPSLSGAYVLVRGKFSNKSEIYKLSIHCANTWFPIEENYIKEKSESIIIKYSEKPIVTYKGKDIVGFEGSPYSFAMLLNLAARRKANKPDMGLAHKVDDLLDDSQGEKGYGNLRTIMAHQQCEHLLKANRNRFGKLSRDRKVYLDIKGKNIFIENSIRKYKSDHRKAVLKLIKKQEKKWITKENAEDFYNKLEKKTYHLLRCELLIDDAIKRLGFMSRPKEALVKLKQIVEQAESILDNLNESYRIKPKIGQLRDLIHLH